LFPFVGSASSYEMIAVFIGSKLVPYLNFCWFGRNG
jgi:hypothetical protein